MYVVNPGTIASTTSAASAGGLMSLMGGPAGWAFAGLGLLGGLMGSGSSNRAGEAAARAAEYNAKIRARNAKVAEMQGEWQKFLAGTQVQDFREQFEDFRGAQAVAYAKANVVSTEGTARLVQEEAAREADDQIAMIEMQGETNAMQFREKAVNENLEANLQRLYARQYKTAGRYRSYGALLGGASKAAYILASA